MVVFVVVLVVVFVMYIVDMVGMVGKVVYVSLLVCKYVCELGVDVYFVGGMGLKNCIM